MNTPENKQLIMQFLSEPTDINYGGKVHGGVVMKWIDQAGFACASQWCDTYCVTVYVGGIRFFKPIHIGSLVKIVSRVIYTGTTSIHIAVDVYSKHVTSEQFEKNTHCIIVFVAMEHDKPKKVPPFVPSTDEEKQMQEYALKLMKLRTDIEKEMQPFAKG